jgi:ATP-dependent Clp protease ATP-binding subunit ClpB
VLDDGRLTDSHGNIVNFTNTIIILTSNLGSQFLVEIDEDDEDLTNKDKFQEKAMEVVRSHFRPEFLNRLDEIIMFNKLNRNDMDAIVEVQLSKLASRLLNRNIYLIHEENARHYLASKGYDSQYGARPLKRVIQREIENILAEKILRSQLVDGQNVKLNYVNEALEFVVENNIIKRD